MRITRRRVVQVTLAGAIVAAAVYVLRPKAIAVETALATRAPMRATVDAEGRTTVRDRFAVAAPVAGRLKRLAVREGDRVVSGQVVAWIAPLPLDAQTRRQAEARLVAAQALRHEAEDRKSVV